MIPAAAPIDFLLKLHIELFISDIFFTLGIALFDSPLYY
jgi:hypothetical protein